MSSSLTLQESNRLSGLRLVAAATITLFSAPALANAPIVLPCPTASKVTLDVPAAKLMAIEVSHDISMATLDDIASKTVEDTVAPSEFLSPRAEDAIRAAFDENAKRLSSVRTLPLLSPVSPISNTESAKPIEADTHQPADTHPSGERLMHTRLPGISDDELSRYKKQMYRRDI